MRPGPPSPTATSSSARPARAQLQFHVHEPASSSSLPTVWDVTWPNAPPFCPFTLPQSQSHDAGCVSSSASALADSSRSQFHVHSQTWRPLTPGCWMPLPSTTTERFVSSPSGGGRNRDPGAGRRRALLGDCSRGSGASDPDRDVRVLDAVLCRLGGRSIVAGGVRGGDGRVGLGDRPVVPGREHADRDVRVRGAVLRRDGDRALVDRALAGLGGRDRGGGGRAGGVRLLDRPVVAGAPDANGHGGVLRVGLCRRPQLRPPTGRSSTGADVSAAAVASAPAAAWFSCETGGPFPGLSTLTLDWLLPTPCWCAVAAAFAACATEPSCSLPLPAPPRPGSRPGCSRHRCRALQPCSRARLPPGSGRRERSACSGRRKRSAWSTRPRRADPPPGRSSPGGRSPASRERRPAGFARHLRREQVSRRRRTRAARRRAQRAPTARPSHHGRNPSPCACPPAKPLPAPPPSSRRRRCRREL